MRAKRADQGADRAEHHAGNGAARGARVLSRFAADSDEIVRISATTATARATPTTYTARWRLPISSIVIRLSKARTSAGHGTLVKRRGGRRKLRPWRWR